MSCYCGNTQPYSQCCEPIHLNPHSAQVPEQLMRARFSAHILKNVEFVIETYHPSCQASNERDAISESVHSHWLRLEIISTQMGATPNEGFVHFKAFLDQEGKVFCLEERSRFLKEITVGFILTVNFQPPSNKAVTTLVLAVVARNIKKCCG